MLVLLIGSSAGYAGITKEGNTFIEQSVKEQEKELPYTYKDKKGREYKIYQSKKGSLYIIKTSEKTGNEYKYYLPKEVQEEIKKHIKAN